MVASRLPWWSDAIWDCPPQARSGANNGVELTGREHMRLHNWGRCVMAEINAVLAGLTAEELEETSQLCGRGPWGGN